MSEYKSEQLVQAYEIEPLQAKLEINRFLKEHDLEEIDWQM